MFDINWALKSGSFTIKNGANENRFTMLDMVFERFSSRIQSYPGSSVRVNVELAGMECTDGTTPGTLYPHLIRAKKHERYQTFSKGPSVTKEKTFSS